MYIYEKYCGINLCFHIIIEFHNIYFSKIKSILTLRYCLLTVIDIFWKFISNAGYIGFKINFTENLNLLNRKKTPAIDADVLMKVVTKRLVIIHVLSKKSEWTSDGHNKFIK